jgi:hypothetical protein
MVNGGPISRIAYPARIPQLGEPLSPQIAGAAVAGFRKQAPAAAAPRVPAEGRRAAEAPGREMKPYALTSFKLRRPR